MIIKTRREIVDHINAAFQAVPDLMEMAEAIVEDNPSELDEIKKELLALVQAAEDHPEYGEDWSAWFDEHLVDLAQEAASIVA